MPEQKTTKVMTGQTRMRSSKNGNPRYLLHFDDATSYPTEPDSGLAYGITNRDMQNVPLEITLNGRNHITYARKLGPDEIEPAPYTEREQRDFDRLVQRYTGILKSKELAELAAGAAVALQRELDANSEEETMCP